MSAPVKLSRERWEMLADSCWTPNPGALPSTRLAGLERVFVDKPREIRGVIFLPAEYVPAAEPYPPINREPVSWWLNAQDHDPR